MVHSSFALLGGAESFIMTGATVWGLARVGTQNAGKVIAWMGTAMFAAFAAGAPLGIALYQFPEHFEIVPQAFCCRDSSHVCCSY